MTCIGATIKKGVPQLNAVASDEEAPVQAERGPTLQVMTDERSLLVCMKG